MGLGNCLELKRGFENQSFMIIIFYLLQCEEFDARLGKVFNFDASQMNTECPESLLITCERILTIAALVQLSR